jgi:hypothetical protein
MKFQDLYRFDEGFDSLQTQDSQTGNSDQYQKGLTPDQYRSSGASEYEEEKPYSIEKNKLKAVIEELKLCKSMDKSQINTCIGKLADVFRSMN